MEAGKYADPYGLRFGKLHLWTCAIDETVGGASLGRLCAVLSPNERERSTRLRHAVDQRRFVTSHAFVRFALSQHCAVEASCWEFGRTAEGKPFIAAPNLGQMPSFSLSHTEGMATCLIGLSAEAGVDIEKLTHHDDLPLIAPSILAAGELESLSSYDGMDWTVRFFQHWTLKEAYAKARGFGLALRPRDIGFEIDVDGEIRGHFAAALRDDPSSWYFQSHRPSPAHILSLAVPAESNVVFRSFTFEAT